LKGKERKSPVEVSRKDLMKDMDLGLGFRKDRVLEEMQGRV
jgi:hypothetical protein